MAERARVSDFSTAALDRVREAISAVRERTLDPFGITLTHIMSPDFVRDNQPIAEVSLVAEIAGEPSYFDLFGAEDAIASELGLEVCIIPLRAVSSNHSASVKAGMLAL
jgi:hypothetical protein